EAPRAADLELDRHAPLEAVHDRDAARQRLEVVDRGLLVEVRELLRRRAAVGDGEVVGDVALPEAAADLEAGRRADGVARDQRRRDAEAIGRLAPPVLEAERRLE